MHNKLIYFSYECYASTFDDRRAELSTYTNAVLSLVELLFPSLSLNGNYPGAAVRGSSIAEI